MVGLDLRCIRLVLYYQIKFLVYSVITFSIRDEIRFLVNEITIEYLAARCFPEFSTRPLPGLVA